MSDSQLMALAYGFGAMGFLAFKGWADARAGSGTKIFDALAASLFWPIVWPIMAGQLLGAPRKRSPNDKA